MVKIDRSRKYLLIAGVVVLLIGAVYRIWPQMQDIFGAGNSIALKKRQIVKYQATVKASENLQADVESLKKALEKGEKGLLTGKTAALAAADIQKVLQEMAEKSQVEIKTVRVLKADTAKGGLYLSVPVQLSIFSTIGHLKEFLYKIMVSAKYLTVEKVAITVRRARKGELKRVSANITVNGFLKRIEG
jgi:hypothetical protein